MNTSRKCHVISCDTLPNSVGNKFLSKTYLFPLKIPEIPIVSDNLSIFRDYLIMQKMGVEPTRYCYHTDLNRARLPIPPLLRLREMGLEPTRAYTHKILSLACLPIPALPRTNNSISHKFHLINHFLQIFLNYFFRFPLDIYQKLSIININIP